MACYLIQKKQFVQEKGYESKWQIYQNIYVIYNMKIDCDFGKFSSFRNTFPLLYLRCCMQWIDEFFDVSEIKTPCFNEKTKHLKLLFFGFYSIRRQRPPNKKNKNLGASAFSR